MRRRVELSALFAFSTSELSKEVFVYSAEHILCSICRTAESNITYEVDELSESLLVEAGARIVLR